MADVKPDTKPNIKPTITADGHEIYEIPVEQEELDIGDSANGGNIWAMKIPRFLYERWERVNVGGVHLGTLMVDNSSTPAKVTLKLPQPKDDEEEPANKRARLNVEGIPDEFEVNLPEGRLSNTFIFTEHKRTWVAAPGEESSSAKRKREKAHPKLVGALAHEGSVRPKHSPKYLKILEQRRLESENSKRPIVQLDDKNMSQAKLNQLASGFSNASSTLGKGMVLGTARVAPGERFARLERNELVDRLFGLFNEKPYWSITALKATLQQPDAWLREVLKDVASLIKEGQYANMWELKDNWKDVPAPSAGDSKPKVEKMEENDDDDDEEEDEDDFEIVAA